VRPSRMCPACTSWAASSPVLDLEDIVEQLASSQWAGLRDTSGVRPESRAGGPRANPHRVRVWERARRRDTFRCRAC